MEILLITLIAMWVNPILGFFLAKYSRNNIILRKQFLIIFASFTFVEILAIITKISFSSTIADFVFVSFFYLGLCFFIWILIFNNRKIIKIIAIIIASVVFGINYLSGTIGILGVGFVLNDWMPRQEIILDNNLKYKEIPFGMATSDFRGKRIEIYKELRLLPFERKIISKEYINEAPGFTSKLNVDYNNKNKELYLLISDTLRNGDILDWADTIKIIKHESTTQK